MARRIRTIKPEILDDELVGNLSSDAWRLFVGMFVLADDYGNLRGHPDHIASEIFKYEKARESLAKIPGGLASLFAELEDACLIHRYEVRRQRFISLTGWARHQRVDKPGKPAVPAPNDPGAIPLAKIPGGLANVPETLATDLDQDQDQEHEVARAPLTLLQGSTAAPGGMSAKGVPRRRSASAESMDLAKYLQDAIRESGPSTEVTDAAVEGWAEHIDKAVRLDKIPPASIRAAVDYAHRSPSGVFWRANILSGKKLREKLPTLLRQMDRDKPVKSASGTWEDL